MLSETARIDDSPELFNLEGITADNIPLHDVFDHPRDRVRVEGYAVSFPKAFNFVIGGQLQEDPIWSSMIRSWIGDHVCLDICYFHNNPLPRFGIFCSVLSV